MRGVLIALLIFGPAVGLVAEPQRAEPKKEAEVNLTPGATARPGLLGEILKADAAVFKAFFDDCDAEAVRRLVTDDFEMFHDKGGRVITSGDQFATITKEKCQRQEEGVDFLSTRELVLESVKVFSTQ